MSRLLIVDDEPGILEIVEYMIQDAGFETVTASNGRDAFDLANKGGVSCILTDIKMPGGNGLELLERVVTSMGKSLPVILMSGHLDLHPEELSKKGAFSFIPKPLDFKMLLAMINSAISPKP